MPTLAESNLNEFVALQDLLDALELTAPHDERIFGKIHHFRAQLETLGDTPLPYDDPAGLLLAIHREGEQLYKASVDWPQGSFLGSQAIERERIKMAAVETVGLMLADGDLPRFLDTLNTLMPGASPSIKMLQRLNTIEPAHLEHHYHETAATMKQQVSEATQGRAPAITPTEAFDPLYLTIERGSDTADAAVALYYDGALLVDNVPDHYVTHALGHPVQAMTDTQALSLARDAFYMGVAAYDIPPMCRISRHDLIAGIEQDISDLWATRSPEVKEDLDRIAMHLEPLKAILETDTPQATASLSGASVSDASMDGGPH